MNLPTPATRVADLQDFPTLLTRVPKAELHVHLDGCLRTGTILDLAREFGLQLPTWDPTELDAILRPGASCASLEEYLRAFHITTAVLRTPESIARVAFEMLVDCAADNVRYVEVRYSPFFMTAGGLSLDEAILAVEHGCELASRDTGISYRQIICAMRHTDPQVSVEIARAALRTQDRAAVVAFDLAGAEAPFPAAAHREAYDLARRACLHSTVHAGEAAGPDSIQQALVELGAQRIGHGTRLRESERLMRHVLEREIPIEVCVTSNVQTRACDGFADHPALSYLRMGARAVICTDNMAISGTTVSNELEILARMHELTVGELRQLIANSFDAAFISLDERASMRRGALAELDRLLAASAPSPT